MTRLTNPLPLFLDGNGALLDGGSIYVGVVGADPQSQPISVFWDVGRTIPAAQPLRTLGGVIVNGATPSQVFMAEDDYSLRVVDADDQLLRYDPTSFPLGLEYQPLDSDLSAIAALGTTEYGRALLTLASRQQLRAAVGYPEPLPLSGGALTGGLFKQGAGKYLHHLDGNLDGDTLSWGTTDPSGGATGDLYFQYSV